MKLYEITGMLADVLRQLEIAEDNGDLDMQQTCRDTLESLEGDLQDKMEGCAEYLKNKKAELSAVEAEVKNFNQRRITLKNEIDWIQNYMRWNMEKAGTDKIQAGAHRVSIKANGGKLPIIFECDPDQLPIEYVEAFTEFKPNQEKIREALDAGLKSEYFHYGQRGSHLEVR